MSFKHTFSKCHQTLKQIATSSPRVAANYISLPLEHRKPKKVGERWVNDFLKFFAWWC